MSSTSRNLHLEAASQIAYARHSLKLVKMGAYTGAAAKQMRENAEFMIRSAKYKSRIANMETTR